MRIFGALVGYAVSMAGALLYVIGENILDNALVYESRQKPPPKETLYKYKPTEWLWVPEGDDEN